MEGILENNNLNECIPIAFINLNPNPSALSEQRSCWVRICISKSQALSSTSTRLFLCGPKGEPVVP